MKTERESKLQKRCIDIIRSRGGYVYKNAQSMYTETGRPDLTCCIPVDINKFKEIFPEKTKVGVFVGIELKRQDHLNEVSDAQKIVGNKIINSGGLWFALDDSDVLEALLERLMS